VFVPKDEDIPMNDTFFPVRNIGDKVEKKAVADKAKAWVKEKGFTKYNDKAEKELPLKAFISCYITIKPEDVLNKVVDWENDRVICIPFFASGWRSVMKPSIGEVELPDVGKHWVRISFKVDPKDPTREDADGEEVDNLVAFIAELFASKEDAVKSVGIPADNESDNEGDDETSASSEPSGDAPDNWTWDAWVESWPDIRDELKDSTMKSVADNWGVTVPDIRRIPAE